MPLTRRAALAALATAPFASIVVRAETFPSRPVTLIVPFPAGGSTDVMNRTVAEKLQALLGQPVVVEFKPGAGGNLGTEAAAKARPDGHTLVFVALPQVIGRSIYPKLNYDLFRDLEPIGIFLETSPVLIVNPQLGVKSVAELVALAKSKPGALEYGTGGNGTSAHLLGEMFKRRTGTNLLHVPYKGAAAALTDLVGGQVKVMFETASSVVGHARTGRIVPLAVHSLRRSPVLPDVPTIAEAGFPGLELAQWAALMTPAGAPRPVVDALASALAKVTAMPDVRARFAEIGAEPLSMPPAATLALLRAEAQKTQDIVQSAGIRIE